VLFLARTNGLLYIINSVDDTALVERSAGKLAMNAITFLVFFLFFVVTLLTFPGYAYETQTGTVSIEKYKYLHNLLQMPMVLIFFLAGVVGVLYGIGITLIKGSRKGIWYTGCGTLLAVMSMFLIAGLNGTPFYPSSFDLNSSLTINRASSSLFTLKTMMYVSFIIPFVVAYIWYAWRSINNKRITEEEMNTDSHIY
jgi:cytochrome d ubiquinol oxidase subunit II